MDAVAVISASGKPLMPTNPMRARKLIKKGKAVIYKYRPLFTIRLTERTDGDIQTIEEIYYQTKQNVITTAASTEKPDAAVN